MKSEREFMSYHQDWDEMPQNEVRRDPIVHSKTIAARRKEEAHTTDEVGAASKQNPPAVHARGGHKSGKKRRSAPKRERMVLLMILASVALIFLFDALCSGKLQPRQEKAETEQQTQTSSKEPASGASTAQPEQQAQTADLLCGLSIQSERSEEYGR